MAEQFSAEWAKGVIQDGVGRAQEFIGDPEKINGLLQQVQDKMGQLPDTVGNAFRNVPLMASMVKSYVTREYTDVSPKVVISLVSAFIYLVKQKDLIPDNIPVVGLADDLAVAAIAMAINEPELKAYAEWRDANAASTTATCAATNAETRAATSEAPITAATEATNDAPTTAAAEATNDAATAAALAALKEAEVVAVKSAGDEMAGEAPATSQASRQSANEGPAL